MSPENCDGPSLTFLGVTLVVSNIDGELTKERLTEEFSKFGDVQNVEMIDGPIKTALMTYFSPAEAQNAVQCLNGKSILKNTLYVGLKKPYERRRSRFSYNDGGSSNLNLSSSWDSNTFNNANRRRSENLSYTNPQPWSPTFTNNATGTMSNGDSLINFKRRILSRTGSFNG